MMHLHGIHLIDEFRDELKELYLHRALRAFGESLVSVFIPIYIIKLGFPIEMALLYLIARYAFQLIAVPLVMVSDGRIGLKHTILISSFLIIGLIVFLHSCFVISTTSILILGLLGGIDVSFYWIPLNIEFGLYSKDGRRGRETAMLSILPRIGKVFAPVVSAFVIVSYGFQSLLVVASVIIIGSMVPLFLTREHWVRRKPLKSLFIKKNLKFTGMLVAKGFFSACMIVWPIFTFLFMDDYVSIGSIISLQIFVSILATALIGRFSDRFDMSKIFRFVGAFAAISFFSLIFVRTPLQLAIGSILAGVSYAMIIVPTFAYLCNNTDREHMPQLMGYRDVVFPIVRISMFSILLLMPLLLGFKVIFLLTSIAGVYLAFFNQGN